MATNLSPIFPGRCTSRGTTVAASTIANYTIHGGDSTYPTLINAVHVYNKGSAGAVTVRLEVEESGSIWVLCRTTVGTNQYETVNLLKNSLIPMIDDNNPILNLKPGQTLRLAVENSVNNALDVFVPASSYQEPA